MSETLMKFTDEEKEAAKEKKEISCFSLLQEIEPLLKEYFISIVDRSESKITMSFLNGQKFDVTVNHVG